MCRWLSRGDGYWRVHGLYPSHSVYRDEEQRPLAAPQQTPAKVYVLGPTVVMSPQRYEAWGADSQLFAREGTPGSASLNVFSASATFHACIQVFAHRTEWCVTSSSAAVRAQHVTPMHPVACPCLCQPSILPCSVKRCLRAHQVGLPRAVGCTHLAQLHSNTCQVPSNHVCP